jgi:ATP-binding cassette subfamily C protein
MVVLGLTEGIGVVMLIPLLNLASIGSGMPGGGGFIAGVGIFLRKLGFTLNLPMVLLFYVAVISGQSWFQRYQSMLTTEIQQSYTSFLSNRLFQAVASAKWSFLLSRAKSDVTHILTSELTRVSSGTYFFLQMLATVLIAVVQVGIALVIAPGLTLWVLAGAIVLSCCLYPFIRESRRMGMEISQNNRNLFFEVTQYLNGIKEVKSYGLETVQIQNFAKLRRTIEDNFVRFNRVQSQTDMWYKVAAAVYISLFFYAAIAVFKLRPQEFLVIIVIFSRLWPRFSSFQSALQQVVMMLPAFRMVQEMETASLKERELIQQTDNCRLRLTQGIEFRHLSFAYDTVRSGYAVQDINLNIPAGQTVALVGVSGSGKSTLADLLIGLLTPNQGDILLDGSSLEANIGAWRRSIGYVSQDAFLFNASIRENLQWSAPETTEDEIWQALGMAAIDEFVRGLQEGLDTQVGDRGVCLSGGERQRIVLARALLRKPTILILDEATSSLDLENERHIQEAIESLHGKLTMVVIAHRLTTIKNADRIILMDRGKIVEQGVYQKLITDQNSRFYRLANVTNG